MQKYGNFIFGRVFALINKVSVGVELLPAPTRDRGEIVGNNPIVPGSWRARRPRHVPPPCPVAAGCSPRCLSSIDVVD